MTQESLCNQTYLHYIDIKVVFEGEGRLPRRDGGGYRVVSVGGLLENPYWAGLRTGV